MGCGTPGEVEKEEKSGDGERVEERRSALTAGVLHPARDGGEDAAVAEHHDEQGQEEEAGEGEHVVERLLPVCPEAAHRGALHEAPGPRPPHRAEDKRLQRAGGGGGEPSASFLLPAAITVLVVTPPAVVTSPPRCPPAPPAAAVRPPGAAPARR